MIFLREEQKQEQERPKGPILRGEREREGPVLREHRERELERP